MEPTFESLIIFISLLWFRSNRSLCLSRSICIMLSFHVYYSVRPVTWRAIGRQRPVSLGHTKQISQGPTCVIAENLVCNSESRVLISECPWSFLDDSSAWRSPVTHSGLTGCHWALPPAAPALHSRSAVVLHRYHTTLVPACQWCRGAEGATFFNIALPMGMDSALRSPFALWALMLPWSGSSCLWVLRETAPHL